MRVQVEHPDHPAQLDTVYTQITTGGPGLCLLLPLPRAHRVDRRRAGRHQGQGQRERQEALIECMMEGNVGRGRACHFGMERRAWRAGAVDRIQEEEENVNG